MAKRYEVTGACVTHIPVSTSQGTMLTTLYRGAMLPADVPAKLVKHLLDGNLIKPLDEPASEGPADEDDPDAPLTVNSRSSKAELVAYGAAQGDDRAALKGMTVKELQELYVKGDEPQ